MAKKSLGSDPFDAAEREIREILNRHFGRLPEEAYVEQSLEVLAVINDGLEMRKQELESEGEE